jgi:hypothetical protein
MARLLGIVHMNPEKDPSEWGHQEVRFQLLHDFKFLQPALTKLISQTYSI